MPNQSKWYGLRSQNFRNVWMMIFFLVPLARQHTLAWKGWWKRKKLPRDVEGRNAALAASSICSQGRLQRDDTWRTAEVETESFFLNVRSLTTHMTWPRRGNGSEMGSVLARVLSLHAVRQPVISLLLLPASQLQLQPVVNLQHAPFSEKQSKHLGVN